MRWLLFVGVMVVTLAARLAWADDVKTTSSCSRAKTEKVCSFDIKIVGEITSMYPLGE
jgi:hypothetical protein